MTKGAKEHENGVVPFLAFTCFVSFAVPSLADSHRMARHLGVWARHPGAHRMASAHQIMKIGAGLPAWWGCLARARNARPGV